MAHPQMSPEQVNLRPATEPQKCCATCVMWTELAPGEGRCDLGFNSYGTDTCDEYEAAQPDHSDSSMLALYPPPALARALAVDGGLDPEDMHLTVAYTGDAAQVDRDKLRAAAKALAKRPPLVATISGHARFTGGKQDAIVALVDSPALEQLRADARRELAKQGIDIPSEHGFTAHMTLKYVDKGDESPVDRLEPRKVRFSGITAAHGDDHKTASFDRTLERPAREAFAAGWALSGGPIDESMREPCDHAVWDALGNPDDLGVLEATLKIGQLRGAWADVFKRRERLTKQHTKAVVGIVAGILASLSLDKFIDRLRAEAPAGAYSGEYLKVIAGQAASGLLSGVYSHDDHGTLAGAVQDALRSAMAEGQAGMLAVAAEQHHADEFDFETAYKAVYDRLENLPDLPLMAQQWVQRFIGGAARQTGSLLAQMLEQGLSKPDMLAQLRKALDVTDASSPTGRAAEAFLDQSISQAMSAASLNLYASEGAQQAYFVTAGDAAVCPICQQAQDGNPYTIADVPNPGLHPFCRCVVTVLDPNLFAGLAADVAYQDA